MPRSCSAPAAAHQARAGDRPGGPPSLRHQPDLPARPLHPDPPDKRHHRPAAAGARHRRRLGMVGGRFARTSRPPAWAPATGSRSPSPSVPTSSSGPPKKGPRLGALAVPLGGMSSVQRLRTIAEVGATALGCTPTYALRLAEVAVAERLEAALDSSAIDLHRRARGVAARGALADRGGLGPGASTMPGSPRPARSAIPAPRAAASTSRTESSSARSRCRAAPSRRGGVRGTRGHRAGATGSP